MCHVSLSDWSTTGAFGAFWWSGSIGLHFYIIKVSTSCTIGKSKCAMWDAIFWKKIYNKITKNKIEFVNSWRKENIFTHPSSSSFHFKIKPTTIIISFPSIDVAAVDLPWTRYHKVFVFLSLFSFEWLKCS